MKTLFYNRNIKGKTFKKFVHFMGGMFPKFSLSYQKNLKRFFTDEAKQALVLLEPFLLSSEEVWETPGSYYAKWKPDMEPPAELKTYRSCRDSLDIITTQRDRLFRWQGPRFPEDLAFYRDDGSNSFGTVAHEHYSFFKFTPEELEKLKKEFPFIRWNVKKS